MATMLKLTIVETGQEFQICQPVLELAYRLEGGLRLTMQVETAWCSTCREFREVEIVKTEEELQKELADLDDETSEIRQMFCQLITYPPHRDESLARLRLELQRRIEWRRGRQSPSKCRKCGGHQLTPIPIGRRVPHPGMPGLTISLDVIGHASIARDCDLYTPEGEPISRPPRQPLTPPGWNPPVMKTPPKRWWRFW